MSTALRFRTATLVYTTMFTVIAFTGFALGAWDALSLPPSHARRSAIVTAVLFGGCLLSALFLLLLVVIRIANQRSENKQSIKAITKKISEYSTDLRIACREILGGGAKVYESDELKLDTDKVRARLLELSQTEPLFSQDFTAVLVLVEHGLLLADSGYAKADPDAVIQRLLIARNLLSEAIVILQRWRKAADGTWTRHAPIEGPPFALTKLSLIKFS